jgi:hypothetical protein
MYCLVSGVDLIMRSSDVVSTRMRWFVTFCLLVERLDEDGLSPCVKRFGSSCALP